MRAEQALKGSITKLRFPDYFRQLVIRSWMDAWGDVVGQKPRAICIAVGVVALTLFFYWQTKGFDQMTDALFAVGATVAATIVVALLFFCVYLFLLSPKRLCEEREEDTRIVEAERDELRQELSRKSTAKELRATLYKICDLIQSSKNDPESKRIDALGGLIRFADELRDEQDVEWMCSALFNAGHGSAFYLLDTTSNKSFLGRKLSFLQEARASSIEIRRVGSAAYRFAAHNWSQQKHYNIGHGIYAGWHAEHPDEVFRPPNLDAEDSPSPDETRESICLKLSAYLEKANAVLVNCRKGNTYIEESIDKFLNDIDSVVLLAAGEAIRARLASTVGIPAPDNPPEPNTSQRETFDRVYPVACRLHDLIEKIESGTHVPFSRPILDPKRPS